MFKAKLLYLFMSTKYKATMPDRAYFVAITIKTQGYLAQLLTLHIGANWVSL